MGDLSEHFSRHEFECQCGCGFDSVDSELITVLERIRNKYEQPVTITSGCRCNEHNNTVGGSDNSQHTKGKAADFKVGTMPTEIIARVLDTLYPNKYGIGIYKTWVHVDVRVEKARWDNR